MISQGPSSKAATAGGTELNVAAGGTGQLQYQWYAVNEYFDLASYKAGAVAPQSSTLIAGATTDTFIAPSTSAVRGYWVRVSGSCGTADTDIAVVVPRPVAPAVVTATAQSVNSVLVSWSGVTGAEKYHLQRKALGQPWQTVSVIPAGTTHISEPVPAGHNGVIAYRVLAATGSSYLPQANPSLSEPSNIDYANVAEFGYDAITPGQTFIRAQHIVDIRQGANAIAATLGVAEPFAPGDVQVTNVIGSPVLASDFVAILGAINILRTQCGLPQSAFTASPAAGEPILASQINELRSALR